MNAEAKDTRPQREVDVEPDITAAEIMRGLYEVIRDALIGLITKSKK